MNSQPLPYYHCKCACTQKSQNSPVKKQSTHTQYTGGFAHQEFRIKPSKGRL